MPAKAQPLFKPTTTIPKDDTQTNQPDTNAPLDYFGTKKASVLFSSKIGERGSSIKLAPQIAPIQVLKNKIEQIKNDPNNGLIDRSDDGGYIVYNSPTNPGDKPRKDGLPITRDSDINTNGKVKGVLCRQFSSYQLKSPKTYHITLADPKLIEKEVELKENIYDKELVLFRADSYHYVALEDLGNELYKIIDKTPANKIIYMTFASENHSMSITIDPNGELIIALKFFDPNKSVVHKRVLFKDKASIKNLRIEDLLNKANLNLYFSTFKSGVLAVYNDPRKLRTSTDYTTKLEYADGLDYKNNPGLLYQALAYNDPLLVTAFLAGIKGSGLEEVIIKSLVEARDNNGVSGLDVALYTGNAAMITAFMAGIKELGLSKDIILKLTQLPDKNGVTFLSRVVAHGNVALLTAFIAGMKGFDEDIIFALLEARDNYGLSALDVALYYKDAAKITAFMAGIKELGLSKGHILNLTELCDKNGVPFLNKVLQQGNAAVVTAFIKGLKGLGLGRDMLLTILEACDKNGMTGLSMAFLEGHAEAITAFIEGIKELGLENADIKILLEAIDDEGKSGIEFAKENGNLDAIEAFKEGLKLFDADFIKDINKLIDEV